MTMNRSQARREAHRRWMTPGTNPGDRYGSVIIRRKNVPDRFEVGYEIRGGHSDSGAYLFEWVIMGRGETWEAAFANADVSATAGGGK